MKRRPSIFDLVQKTGFSHGTISRAFNNRYGVNPETRDKILKAAQEMGYSPSSSARTFKTGKTNRWGILLPQLLNPYYAELFECLDAQIREIEQVPYLALCHCSVEKERELLRYWASGEVDAVIIDPLGSTENENLISLLQSWELPVITLNGNFNGRFDSQVYDTRQSQHRAMQYLVQLGHRHIGYVGYQSIRAKEASYYHGYLQFMSEAGLTVRPEDSFFVSNDSEAGRETLIHWPSKPTRPTALICYNDSIALSILTQFNALSVRVPDEISVLGRDDVQVAACVGLSTLRTDRRITAKKIVETLQARIANPDRAIDSIAIPSELVIRRSLGRAPNTP